jgi:molybdenum cofactor guanylyltransferase
MERPAGIILAGGRSRRMGSNKALLPHPSDASRTFLDHLVSILAPLCAETLVVARQPGQLEGRTFPHARVIFDSRPDVGPLMGLYSGLSAMRASHALVVAVDMPHVQPDLLAFLLSRYEEDTVLVPFVEGVPQVLLAVYPRSILPLIETLLEQGRRDPRSLLAVAPVRTLSEEELRKVDPPLRSFIGVNTPEEWRACYM